MFVLTGVVSQLARDRGFGLGMRHQLRKRIRRPPAWSVWPRPSGVPPGSGDEIHIRVWQTVWLMMDLYGSIWTYEQKSTSSCISYDGARDGNSLTSTPCRRTILLQWHALLKVLAGSVGA
jgi:hypothetical protein